MTEKRAFMRALRDHPGIGLSGWWVLLVAFSHFAGPGGWPQTVGHWAFLAAVSVMPFGIVLWTAWALRGHYRLAKIEDASR